MIRWTITKNWHLLLNINIIDIYAFSELGNSSVSYYYTVTHNDLATIIIWPQEQDSTNCYQWDDGNNKTEIFSSQKYLWSI